VADDWVDPPWPWRTMLTAFVPGLRARQRKTRGKEPVPAITLLRTIYLTLVEAAFLLLVVLLFERRPIAPVVSRTVAVFVIVIVGLITLQVSEYSARRVKPLDEAQVLPAFRAAFFLRFAMSELPMLIAFVLFFLTGRRIEVFLVGLALTLIGFARMAPTKTSIDAWDERHRGTRTRPSLGAMLTRPNGGAAGA
jgi:hypothetical protein